MSPPSSASTNEPVGSGSFGGLAGLLDDLGVRWCVAGALAAMRYRRTARHTDDVDLLVEWHPDLLGRLEGTGWDLIVAADPGEPPHLIRARREISVDLLVAQTEYQSVALDRALQHWLSVEDVIVHKLLAWRERDRDDIAAVLDADVSLDEEYVSHWASEWEVADRWAQSRTAR